MCVYIYIYTYIHIHIFARASAMRPCSRICDPAPDLVLSKMIFHICICNAYMCLNCNIYMIYLITNPISVMCVYIYTYIYI